MKPVYFILGIFAAAILSERYIFEIPLHITAIGGTVFIFFCLATLYAMMEQHFVKKYISKSPIRLFSKLKSAPTHPSKNKAA